MRWSWRLGIFWGIEVNIHATFALLIGWVIFSSVAAGQTWGSALLAVSFVLLLFLCVVMHEYGHALTARRFGVQTRDITLYPIGGVARLERIPRNPRQELLIAIAGPAVNFAIAGVLFAALVAANAVAGVDSLWRVGSGNLPGQLMWVNIVLAVFNLAPAFPMDGGRILRALLAIRMPYVQATKIAATIGQLMAVGIGLLGAFVVNNPFLLLIAFFIYMGAAQEASMVEAELAFQGVPVSGAMITDFSVLKPGDPLSRAVDELLAGSQDDFFVVQQGELVGSLPRARLIESLSSLGPDTLVSEAMLPAPPGVPPSASLEAAFQRLREENLSALPVVDGSGLIGMMTMQNVAEFLMVRQAVERLGEKRPADPAAAGSDADAEYTARGFRRWWRLRRRST